MACDCELETSKLERQRLMNHQQLPSDYPTLKSAPIVEGVLDIQFEPLPSCDLDKLEALQSSLTDYPFKSKRFQVQANVQVNAIDGSASMSQSGDVIGFAFTNSSKTLIFQARLNGVTLSVLPPYKTYGALQTEAQRLWEIFCKRVARPRITRLGLRYINRLELPLPFDDFREYIKTIPEIAPGLPQGLSDFRMRLVVPDDRSSSTAIITQVCDGAPVDNSKIPVFFDIDVFRIVNDLDDIALWNTFAELREYKNRLFFGSITPRLQEMFE